MGEREANCAEIITTCASMCGKYCSQALQSASAFIPQQLPEAMGLYFAFCRKEKQDAYVIEIAPQKNVLKSHCESSLAGPQRKGQQGSLSVVSLSQESPDMSGRSLPARRKCYHPKDRDFFRLGHW